MNKALGALDARIGSRRGSPRLLGVFATWRLLAYGYTLAALYAGLLVYLQWSWSWLTNRKGVPAYHDFTYHFVGGLLALQGKAASIYIPSDFAAAQRALVGARSDFFTVWPYPPTDFLVLAPLAKLPYVAAFLTWEAVTLLGLVIVVYLIVQRRPAIALVLASPFTLLNVVIGQTGFLTAGLIGAALLALERRPALAGVFIGCLTYKPQLGILFPVALIAGRQWRAIASAVATTALLAGISIAAFAIDPWVGFPRQLLAQTDTVLIVGPTQGADPGLWGILQTAYGLSRYLGASPTIAWLAQGVASAVTGAVVWAVWRLPIRYTLKAATLSACALVATPYVQAYDLAAVAIPVVFLAKDQLSRGLLKGEQATALMLFAASLWMIPTVGRNPIGALISLTLFGLILRRAVRQCDECGIPECREPEALLPHPLSSVEQFP